MSLLRPGSLFAGRFEIDRVAGAGGMGTVYRARDRLSGDPVALKLLHEPSSSSPDVDRFLREADILANLRHTGIVSHIAHGRTANGESFLAMEWLDGEDLAHRLLRGPMSLADAVLLMRSVAATMATVHEQGIVHRDICIIYSVSLRKPQKTIQRRRRDDVDASSEWKSHILDAASH